MPYAGCLSSACTCGAGRRASGRPLGCVAPAHARRRPPLQRCPPVAWVSSGTGSQGAAPRPSVVFGPAPALGARQVNALRASSPSLLGVTRPARRHPASSPTMGYLAANLPTQLGGGGGRALAHSQWVGGCAGARTRTRKWTRTHRHTQTYTHTRAWRGAHASLVQGLELRLGCARQVPIAVLWLHLLSVCVWKGGPGG